MKSILQRSSSNLTGLHRLGVWIGQLVSSNALIFLGLLAFISWGLFLFNVDGMYWDDWILLAQPPEQVGRLMVSLGGPLSALLHVSLLSLGNGVFGYRAFSFLATVFVGVATYRICLRTMLLSRVDALSVSALSIVFPVFQSRVALINVPTQMYLALFMAGWLLALSNYEKKNVWKRIFSVLFFFCAVQYQSLQFFFAVPALHMLWLEGRGGPWTPKALVSKALHWGKAHIDFLLVPFAALVFQRLIYSPPPSYAGYNSLNLKGLMDGVWLSITALDSSLIQPIISSSPAQVVAVTIFISIFILLQVIRLPNRNNDIGVTPKALIGLGLVVFFFAVYPYCAVGKLPGAWDWTSRFQILVPPGAALIVYGIIKLLNRINRSFALAALLYLLVTFIASDIRHVYAYHVDWMKQGAIIKGLSELDSVRNGAGHAFIFIDDAGSLNSQDRKYRFYELSGFFRKAFGDQSRMGLKLTDCSYRSSFSSFTGMGYNIDGYQGGSIAGVIVIEPGDNPESIWSYVERNIFKGAFTGSDASHSGLAPLMARVHIAPIDSVTLPWDCDRAPVSIQ